MLEKQARNNLFVDIIDFSPVGLRIGNTIKGENAPRNNLVTPQSSVGSYLSRLMMVFMTDIPRRFSVPENRLFHNLLVDMIDFSHIRVVR